MILCYHAWLKLESYWKQSDTETFDAAQKAIEKLLNQIIELMPRTSGNKWHVAKIHEQLHVAENINFFGAHWNVHTGPQEHNHIFNTKKPSKQVQRKKNTLDWQLANRLSEKYVLNAAFNKFLWLPPSKINFNLEMKNDDIKITPSSSKFKLLIKYENGTINVQMDWTTKKIKKIFISWFGESHC